VRARTRWQLEAPPDRMFIVKSRRKLRRADRFCARSRARRSLPMRIITTSTFLAALLATAACGPAAPAPSSPGNGRGSAEPAPAPAGLTADGKFLAEQREFVGPCAPAGSRGGCHTITLSPDGTYRNMLYDAAITGTYEIKDGAVHLSAATPEAPTPAPLTLSADLTKLSDGTTEFVFAPATGE
jgi:hypothetical protein